MRLSGSATAAAAAATIGIEGTAGGDWLVQGRWWRAGRVSRCGQRWGTGTRVEHAVDGAGDEGGAVEAAEVAGHRDVGVD